MTEWRGDEIVVLAKSDTDAYDRCEQDGYEMVDLTAGSTDRYMELHPWSYQGYMDVIIPVWQCAPETMSYTVGGVWEGLKMIGRIGYPWTIKADYNYFTGMGYDLYDDNLIKLPQTRKPLLGEEFCGFYNGRASTGLYRDFLNIVEAREKIFFPAYRYFLWASPRCCQLREELQWKSRERPIALIDDTTDIDWRGGRERLSHAAIIRDHVMGRWPYPTAERGTCYDYKTAYSGPPKIVI